MVEESKVAIVANFSLLKTGRVLAIPLSFITPSQINDGRKSDTKGPISAFIQDGEIIVEHGNHRVRDMQRIGTGNRKMQVRKAESPVDHINN